MHQGLIAPRNRKCAASQIADSRCFTCLLNFAEKSEKLSRDCDHYMAKGRVQIVNQTRYSDQIIIRYLLNDMPSEEEAFFEEDYLADGDLFDDIRALEEELIDEYVRGSLSDYERQRFERHYLATATRRARVETARQLAHLCKQQSPAQAPAGIWNGLSSLRSYLRLLTKQPLTVATALFLVLAVSLGIEVFRLQGRRAALNEEHAALLRRNKEVEQNSALASKPEEHTQSVGQEKGNGGEKRPGNHERAQPQSATDQTVLLALVPGSRDIKGQKKAVISSQTKFLQLRVDLEQQDGENSGPYRVVVHNIDNDKEIWAQDGIKPRRKISLQSFLFKVPADRFRTAGSQDFMVTLSVRTANGGYEEIDSSYFRILIAKP